MRTISYIPAPAIAVIEPILAANGYTIDDYHRLVNTTENLATALALFPEYIQFAEQAGSYITVFDSRQLSNLCEVTADAGMCTYLQMTDDSYAVVIDLAFANAITPRRQSMVKYNLMDAQRHVLSNTGLQWNQIRYHGQVYDITSLYSAAVDNIVAHAAELELPEMTALALFTPPWVFDAMLSTYPEFGTDPMFEIVRPLIRAA